MNPSNRPPQSKSISSTGTPCLHRGWTVCADLNTSDGLVDHGLPLTPVPTCDTHVQPVKAMTGCILFLPLFTPQSADKGAGNSSDVSWWLSQTQAREVTEWGHRTDKLQLVRPKPQFDLSTPSVSGDGDCINPISNRADSPATKLGREACQPTVSPHQPQLLFAT